MTIIIPPRSTGLLKTTGEFVKSAISAISHPADTSLGIINHVLTGIQNPYLNQLIEDLLRLSELDHFPADQYEHLKLRLKDLKSNPKLWGINTSFKPEDVQVILDLLEEERIDTSKIKENLSPLIFHRNQTLGIVSNLASEFSHFKSQTFSDLKVFLDAQFNVPQKLEELKDLLSNFTKEHVCLWKRNLKDEEIKTLFFGNHELTREELASLNFIMQFFHKCSDNGSSIEPIEISQLQALIDRSYQLQLGSIKKVESTFRRVIQEVMKAFESKKIELKKTFDELSKDLPDSIYDCLSQLESIHFKETAQDQFKVFRQAFSPFINPTNSTDKTLLIQALFGEVIERTHANYPELENFLLLSRSVKNKFQETLSKDKHAPKLEKDLLKPMIDQFKKLISLRTGFLSKARHDFFRLLEKEKIIGPPRLKALLVELFLLSDTSTQEKKWEVATNLQEFSRLYQADLDAEQIQFLSRFVDTIKSDSKLTSLDVLRAQNLVLNSLKNYQGSSFQIIDHLKQELTDKRTGLASTCISSIIAQAKEDTLKDAPLILKQIYEHAESYFHKRKNFDSLRLLCTQAIGCEELMSEEKALISRVSQEHFDEWFSKLKKTKENHQGLVAHFADLLKEKVQLVLSPVLSLFPSQHTVEDREKTNQDSFFSKLLSMLETTKNDSVKFLAAAIISKIQDWILKTQCNNKSAAEKEEITRFFSNVISQISKTDFSRHEERKLLVQMIKTPLSAYQVMIDNVIALPNFYQVTDLLELESLQASLVDEDPVGKIQSWVENTAHGFENIQRILFEDNLYHNATEEQVEEIVGIIREINSGNIENLKKLEFLINLVFISHADQKEDYTTKALRDFKEPKIRPEKISEQAIASTAHQLAENGAFFLIYQMVSSSLGLDKKLKADHDKVIRELNPLFGEEKKTTYAQRLMDIKYGERESKSFHFLMKDLNPVHRKEDFLARLNHLIQESEANSIAKLIFKYLTPIFYEILIKCSDHVLNHSIELIREISSMGPISVRESLNTEFITQITGFFNKIDASYRRMASSNTDEAVSVFLKSALTEQIKIGGTSHSIGTLISRLNYKLVERFFPKLSLSQYLKGLSNLLMSEIKEEYQTGMYLVKCLIFLPVYLLVETISLFFIKPLEASLNFLGKNALWKLLDLTAITENLIQTIFSKLNSSTGIYHLIKHPAAELMEEISTDELFTNNEESVSSSILSQQDEAKKHLGELYQSLKVAVSWLQQGSSMVAVRQLAKQDNPTSMGFIDKAIHKIETEYFSEALAEGLLELIHKVTQPRFIEEKIIGKGLNSFNQAILGLGHVETIEELERIELASKECDTKFKKATHSVISGVLDQILKHALSELGAKQQKQIGEFFDFVQTEYANIEFNLSEIQDLSLEEKVEKLETIRRELYKKSVEFQKKKLAISTEDSIGQETKSLIDQKVCGLEKIQAKLAEKLRAELSEAKVNYEEMHFGESKARLLQLTEKIQNLEFGILRDIKADEFVSFDEHEELLQQFIIELSKIIPYDIDQAKEISLSQLTMKFKKECESFRTSSEKHKKYLNDYYVKRLLKNTISESKSHLFDSKLQLLENPNDLEARNQLESHLAKLETNIRKIQDSSLALFSQKVLEYRRLMPIADQARAINHKLEELEQMIHEGEVAALCKLTEFTYPGFSSREVDPRDEFIDLSDLMIQLRTAAGKIRKIEYLNFDILEQSSIAGSCKKIILKHAKKEFRNYRDFLNSRVIIETFFYNCIIPSFC